jgi:hypothetical protein
MGDVDLDGDIDLIWLEDRCNPWTTLAMLVNDGFGNFVRDTSRLPGADPTFMSPVLAEDFDNDGDVDLIFTGNEQGTPRVQYWSNDSRGVYRNTSAARLPLYRSRDSWLQSVDFDSDGDIDVAIMDGYGTSWHNNGSGMFIETPTPLPRFGFPYAFGDVSGDNRPDVLVGMLSRIHVYTNRGAWTTAHTSTITPTSLSFTETIRLADIDNDGDADALLLSIVFSTVWVNDGQGLFTLSGSALNAPVTYSADAGLFDYDQDGDTDIWVCNGQVAPQTDQLYVNNGRGIFSDQSGSRIQQQPLASVALATADVDLDGDLDVVVQHLYTPGILYRNLLRDATFVGPVRIGAPATVRVSARRGFASSLQFALPALSLLPPTQVALPPFGTWRLNLNGLALLPIVAVPSPAGEVSFPISVPPQRSLVGQTALLQALIAHDSDVMSWKFTNVARAVIQP